jgi:hypothetical protein
MQSNTVEAPTTDATKPQGCKCEAQIADIVQRLENLERDALTMDKLGSSTLARALSHVEGRSAVIPAREDS